jgi:hypothetical protein
MKNKNTLILLFVIGFLIRIIFFIYYPDQLLPDSLTYEKLGLKFFEGVEKGKLYIYESDVHMPLYSFLSYFFGGRENLIIFDIFISCLTIISIFILTKKLFRDDQIAILAASLFAIYPFSIFYSISGMTETLYVFLIITGFCFMYMKKIFISSIFIILSIYIKPTVEMFFPLIILSSYFIYKERKTKNAIINLLKYSIVYLILMSPWWIHNYIKYDNFVRTNLAMGQILYIGNNPINKSGGGISGIDFKFDSFEVNGNFIEQDPIKRDKIFKKEVTNFVLNNQYNFIQLTLAKLKRFWLIFPYSKDYSNILYKTISILTIIPLYLFSVLFLIKNKQKNRRFIPIFIFCFLINFVHIISISSIRYRFPIEPFLIIISANYLTMLINKYYKQL